MKSIRQRRLAASLSASRLSGKPPRSQSVSSRSRPTSPVSWFEPTGAGLRAYFMPEDDRSSIHVFDVEPAPRGASGPR
jgi:hypothetical protein